MKLVWVLQNIPGLREAAANGEAVYGGVDCWLLYKLTGKIIYILFPQLYSIILIDIKIFLLYKAKLRKRNVIIITISIFITY